MYTFQAWMYGRISCVQGNYIWLKEHNFKPLHVAPLNMHIISADTYVEVPHEGIDSAVVIECIEICWTNTWVKRKF